MLALRALPLLRPVLPALQRSQAIRHRSLVPFLLNDFLDDFRRPTVTDLFDQHFGLHHDPLDVQLAQLLSGPLRAGYVRPWRTGNALESGVSQMKNDKSEFAVNLDVQQFKPEELKVSIQDNVLIIEGQHEERSDEHGFISRHFTRKYLIPDDVDPNTFTSKLSSDGVLTLQAPKKVLESKARELPITHTNEPAKPKEEKPQSDK